MLDISETEGILCSVKVSAIVGTAVVLLVSGCGHDPVGRFSYEEIASQSEGRPMRYGVYLPKGWDGRTPLPVVLLLHGAGDDETAADRRSVVEALDGAIADGTIPPFIMVTPNGDRGFWMNWYDETHRYRDWVLDEVVPAIRRRYPTLEGPEGLHLMGVSMGGGGGMQMWLDDPSRFASATIISAPILDEKEIRKFLRKFMSKQTMERVFGPPGAGTGVDPYAALTNAGALEGSRLIFGAAEHDLGRILDSNEAFHEYLDERDVPHRFITFSGGHGWRSWAPVFVFVLCQRLSQRCTLQTPDGWAIRGDSREEGDAIQARR